MSGLKELIMVGEDEQDRIFNPTTRIAHDGYIKI